LIKEEDEFALRCWPSRRTRTQFTFCFIDTETERERDIIHFSM